MIRRGRNDDKPQVRLGIGFKLLDYKLLCLTSHLFLYQFDLPMVQMPGMKDKLRYVLCDFCMCRRGRGHVTRDNETGNIY